MSPCQAANKREGPPFYRRAGFWLGQGLLLSWTSLFAGLVRGWDDGGRLQLRVAAQAGSPSAAVRLPCCLLACLLLL